MIYECMTGLLLTLSTTAGACHSNTVLHFLLSIINTEAFHSNTYYSPPFPPALPPSLHLSLPFLSPSCWISFPHSLSLSYQRQAKYTENRLKAIKARNEYLLALEATNSCVFKYYIHDLSDIIDVSINTLSYSVSAINICRGVCVRVCACVCVCVSNQWWAPSVSLFALASVLLMKPADRSPSLLCFPTLHTSKWCCVPPHPTLPPIQPVAKTTRRRGRSSFSDG